MEEYLNAERINALIDMAIPIGINILVAIAVFIIGKWVARKVTDIIVV